MEWIELDFEKLDNKIHAMAKAYRIRKREVVRLLEIINKNPRKNKMFFLQEMRANKKSRWNLSKFMTKLVEMGILREERDRNKKRISLTLIGKEYALYAKEKHFRQKALS